MNVAFIGLGVMGFPMAGHLLNAGFNVTAYNRTAIKALSWQQAYPKGNIATESSLNINQGVNEDSFQFDTLPALLKSVDVVISCIGKDEDVEALGLSENGILANLKAGGLWIDHTTTSATVAQKIHRLLKEKDIDFIDAPVSGGEAGAINGQLTVMAGGDVSAYDKALPLFNSYSKSATLIGDSGSGQLTKMVNQICLAGVLQGLSEGIHFAKKAGLDCHKVIDAISKGAAQSWQMDNRATTMINNEFDFGFAINLMRKDLNICIEQAKELDCPLEMTKVIDGYYANIQNAGHGCLDTSALIKQFD